MALAAFLFQVFLISLSGVLAPGPITAATIGRGNKSMHAGGLIAVGHGIVELPLIIAIYLGFGFFFNLKYAQAGIAFFGSIILFLMGLTMIRNIRRVSLETPKDSASAVGTGILLSIGNPYFLIWWATLGAALISKSAGFGLLGFIAFVILHWSCDFIWLYFLSAMSFKGGKFFGQTFQKVIFAVCGAFLIIFAGKFMVDAVKAVL